MELPIKMVIIIVVLLAAMVIILALFGVFGERSNWIMEGLFNFFGDLFSGKAPITPTP